MRVDRLRKSIARLDVPGIRDLIASDPEFLRTNPDFSAQMLSWALRTINTWPASSMTVRGEAARKQLEALRATFDCLIAAGASVNCSDGLEDFPPLFVAVQMVDSLFAEELLERGADPNQAVIGLTPLVVTECNEMKEVLRRFGARG